MIETVEIYVIKDRKRGREGASSVWKWQCLAKKMPHLAPPFQEDGSSIWFDSRPGCGSCQRFLARIFGCTVHLISRLRILNSASGRIAAAMAAR